MRINPYGFMGFGLASPFAFFQDWSPPEFCRSTWLGGLCHTDACVAAACIHLVLAARSDKPAQDRRFPFLRSLSPSGFLMIQTVLGLACGLLAFILYTYLFGFYGLFLSVFSEMTPHSLFGRNGFINSDFFTPAAYLAGRFWPMAAGVLLMNGRDLVSKHPWERFFQPFRREVLRMHLMIVAMPFFSLAAWGVFKNAHQPAAILLLMALFYLIPQKARKNASQTPRQAT